MNPQTLEAGYVVQLSPEMVKNRRFRGCLMTVTDPKPFGAIGYIQVPSDLPDGDLTLIYYRAEWDEMQPVGIARWLSGGSESKIVQVKSMEFKQ